MKASKPPIPVSRTTAVAASRSMSRRKSSHFPQAACLLLLALGTAGTLTPSARAATVGVDCNGPGGALQVSPSTVSVVRGETITFSSSMSCTVGPCAGSTFQIDVPAGPFGGAWSSGRVALGSSVTTPPIAANAPVGSYKYTVTIYDSAGHITCVLDPFIQVSISGTSAPGIGTIGLVFLATALAITSGAVLRRRHSQGAH